MGRYEELGVRPLINASATLTMLGGSRMPPSVVAAIAEGAGAFVELEVLHDRVGERIARLTNNEACFIGSGAAAGLAIAVAACIAGDDPAAVDRFPSPGGPRDEIVVHRSQRNGYDYSARMTGGRLVEVGDAAGATTAQLEAAFSPRTACVLYFAGSFFAAGALPLEDVVRLAHARDVPVIVDAAAQIPPIANLWTITRDVGADLAVFSGGKALRGPQSTGLVLGRADLVAACRRNAYPNHSLGRPMKVGKEEMLGILAAVEWSLDRDEPALREGYEETVRGWVDALAGLPGVTVERGFPGFSGEAIPRAIIRPGPGVTWTRETLIDTLMAGDPSIALARVGDDAAAINPQLLEPGEAETVLVQVRAVLGALA